MLDWSKTYDMYLAMSENQRMGIIKKAQPIVFEEIKKLVEENEERKALLLMLAGEFFSLEEDRLEDEYRYFRKITGMEIALEDFKKGALRGKNKQLADVLHQYFHQIGGEALMAYLSYALSILTLKGELKDEEKELIESIHG